MPEGLEIVHPGMCVLSSFYAAGAGWVRGPNWDLSIGLTSHLLRNPS